MKNLIIALAYIAFLCLIEVNASLKVETTKKVDCTRKTRNGDTLNIHYTVNQIEFVRKTIENFVFFLFFQGFLENGKEFDSSYPRGQAFEFIIGVGNVRKDFNKFFVHI